MKVTLYKSHESSDYMENKKYFIGGIKHHVNDDQGNTVINVEVTGAGDNVKDLIIKMIKQAKEKFGVTLLTFPCELNIVQIPVLKQEYLEERQKYIQSKLLTLTGYETETNNINKINFLSFQYDSARLKEFKDLYNTNKFNVELAPSADGENFLIEIKPEQIVAASVTLSNQN